MGGAWLEGEFALLLAATLQGSTQMPPPPESPLGSILGFLDQEALLGSLAASSRYWAWAGRGLRVTCRLLFSGPHGG